MVALSDDKYIVAVYEFEAGKVASNLVPWVEENMPPRIAERTLVNGNGYKLEKVQKSTVYKKDNLDRISPCP